MIFSPACRHVCLKVGDAEVPVRSADYFRQLFRQTHDAPAQVINDMSIILIAQDLATTIICARTTKDGRLARCDVSSPRWPCASIYAFRFPWRRRRFAEDTQPLFDYSGFGCHDAD